VELLAQDDVVQRAMAQPGDPDYGALSAKIGALARTRSPLKVPAAAFWPAPKVRSATLSIEPFPPGERPEGPVLALAWKMIDRAFQQRRKTLAKTLSAGGACEGLAEIPRPEVEGWLEAQGLTAKARPEELASDKWLGLAGFLLGRAPAAGTLTDR
jgi:16S rRNA (adenine1518-N6/adenine1519-N6)-dimethyltransferase